VVVKINDCENDAVCWLIAVGVGRCKRRAVGAGEGVGWCDRMVMFVCALWLPWVVEGSMYAPDFHVPIQLSTQSHVVFSRLLQHAVLITAVSVRMLHAPQFHSIRLILIVLVSEAICIRIAITV
jgi:hypothetical protein